MAEKPKSAPKPVQPPHQPPPPQVSLADSAKQALQQSMDRRW